ncbi:MAG: carboxypeptidase-like regulatory domain-containing protein [Vicinamibacterales bacterium]
MRSWKALLLTTVTGVLLGALPGAARAAGQAAPNSAGIEGRVTDTSGGVLPGVTVSINSPALQAGARDAVTDVNGRYQFTTLPGGAYEVTFSLTGFQTVLREGVSVGAGFIATIDARMEVGALEESITVTGQSPLVDVRTTASATNITKDVMETIPTSRAYADVGKLAPGCGSRAFPTSAAARPAASAATWSATAPIRAARR